MANEKAPLKGNFGSTPALSKGDKNRLPDPFDAWAVKQHEINVAKEASIEAREKRRASVINTLSDNKYMPLKDANGNIIRGEDGKPIYEDNSCKQLVSANGSGPDEVKIGYEKSGFVKALEDIKSTVDNFAESCAFQTFKKGLAAVSDMKRAGVFDGGMSFQDRLKKAAAALSPLLPMQLSQACQNVVDKFKQKHIPARDGYVVENDGSMMFIMSDEADCAMDLLEMLSGVPGLKAHIKNTIVDVEASAVLLSGMVNSMVDAEMLQDITNVLGISENSWVGKRVIRYTEKAITRSGDTLSTLYILDKGRDAFMLSPQELTENVIGTYKEKTPEDRDRFWEILDKINPNWDQDAQGVFNGDAFEFVSKDAEKALEGRVEYKSLNMIGSVRFIEDYNKKRNPTIAEVTRDLYPLATGPGYRHLPISHPLYLYS